MAQWGMPRMQPADRRALARTAARHVLANGVTADRLTLRMVADQAQMPLASLTYVYGAVGDLLDDLHAEFMAAGAAKQANIGAGGLYKELLKLFRDYLKFLHADRANLEILRWQVLLVLRGELVVPEGLSMAPLLIQIKERSGERWRLSVDDLSTLAQEMISGMHIQFFVRGATEAALEAWWQDARMVVDALVRLAEPGPRPANYRRMRLPAELGKPGR